MSNKQSAPYKAGKAAKKAGEAAQVPDTYTASEEKVEWYIGYYDEQSRQRLGHIFKARKMRHP